MAIINAEKLRAVKILFLKYQKDKDSDIFNQILKRIEPMLDNIAKKLSTNKNDFEDCYVDSLDGLREAILTFAPNKPATVIPRWIFTKSRWVIQQSRRKFDPENLPTSKEDNGSVQLINLSEDLIHTLKVLVLEKIISIEDVELIRHRFIDKLALRQIQEKFGTKYGVDKTTIWDRTNQLLTLIRRELRERGFNHD